VREGLADAREAVDEAAEGSAGSALGDAVIEREKVREYHTRGALLVVLCFELARFVPQPQFARTCERSRLWVLARSRSERGRPLICTGRGIAHRAPAPSREAQRRAQETPHP
jgi:hypothetical protein